jgi:hypothetical protein
MVNNYFKPDQLGELQEAYSTVNPAYERLIGEYLSLRLTNGAAYEYLRHGFVRRLGTLKRCIENVYSIYPLERSDKPSRDELSTWQSICRASYSMSLDASTI